MKIQIDVHEHINQILKQLKKGVLITSKVNEKVNCMTISWGQIGIEWNKLIFTTFVRNGRYTYQMIKDKKEFTVNIPMETRADNIIAFCGAKSGREYDKIKELSLTLVEGDKVDVPGIKELPLTLECKVIYSQLQDIEALPAKLKNKFYPKTSDLGNNNSHTMFMGEIVGAYIAQ